VYIFAHVRSDMILIITVVEYNKYKCIHLFVLFTLINVVCKRILLSIVIKIQIRAHCVQSKYVYFQTCNDTSPKLCMILRLMLSKGMIFFD
jgi:hypothetical protein